MNGPVSRRHRHSPPCRRHGRDPHRPASSPSPSWSDGTSDTAKLGLLRPKYTSLGAWKYAAGSAQNLRRREAASRAGRLRASVAGAPCSPSTVLRGADLSVRLGRLGTAARGGADHRRRVARTVARCAANWVTPDHQLPGRRRQAAVCSGVPRIHDARGGRPVATTRPLPASVDDAVGTVDGAGEPCR